MTRFPDASHAASWTGLCPGNAESAGKRFSGRTRKGDRSLRRILVQSAREEGFRRARKKQDAQVPRDPIGLARKNEGLGFWSVDQLRVVKAKNSAAYLANQPVPVLQVAPDRRIMS
jgi:hypothetical protein